MKPSRPGAACQAAWDDADFSRRVTWSGTAAGTALTTDAWNIDGGAHQPRPSGGPPAANRIVLHLIQRAAPQWPQARVSATNAIGGRPGLAPC